MCVDGFVTTLRLTDFSAELRPAEFLGRYSDRKKIRLIFDVFLAEVVGGRFCTVLFIRRPVTSV